MRYFLLISFLFMCLTSTAQVSVADPRVEYVHTPLGIDVEKPRFSWHLEQAPDERGIRQLTYQITVTDPSGTQVWDSGVVDSDESLNIVYEGNPLQPSSRYDWTVQLTLNNGAEISDNSWFETGLMSLDGGMDNWDGAEWIGGSSEDILLYSHALSVFRAGWTIRLDEESGSTKGAFVFGANDRRLMNRDLNILGVENGMDESYLAFELDISSLEESENGQARLNVYRSGYSGTDDPNKPLYQLDIPTTLINEENKYEAHNFHLAIIFGVCQVYVDGMSEENSLVKRDPNASPFATPGLQLNPQGTAGGDQIVFPLVADIGFRVDEGNQASFSNVEIMNYRAPSNTLFHENLSDDYNGIFAGEQPLSIRENAYFVSAVDGQALVIADPSRNSTPMLRHMFNSDNNKVARARLYVTARGIYEMYLNGERVGEDYFNPGLTQYNKTIMYQTYDVTDALNNGENVIGAKMAEGWWSGNATFRGNNWNYFGDRQSLLAKLEIVYEDGTSKSIVTKPDAWKYFNDGPIIYSSFFQGEVYDSRKEEAIRGWSSPGYDDSQWKSAVSVPVEGTTYSDENLRHDNVNVIAMIGENAGIVKTLTAKSVEEVRPGVFVYDMGQNMVGVPQIRINGQRGDTITMRYAEVRYPDLPEHENYVDMIMMENIRAALTTDVWILKGGTETIQPSFTFHGFRFLEISGITEAIPAENVKGLVISSIGELASAYETSNELVNQLWSNITWSFRGNFLSIPTDTPARNERMGWNGDINVFSRTATYLGSVEPFLRRHLLANRDMQRDDGRFDDIAPVGQGFGGILWGSAAMVIPWELYQQYGDKRVLEEHYDAMKAYVDYLATRQDPETGIIDEGPLGDWLSPEGFKNDNTLLWTAYQVYDLEIVFKTATLLGKTADATKYKSWYNERRAFFHDTYLDPETRKTLHSGYQGPSFGADPRDEPSKKGDLVDTQGSYAIPLALGVINEESKEKVVNNLVATIKRENMDNLGKMRPENSLMTGFIGTASLGPALSQNGYDDLAYTLLQQESYPSWLYSVINGATTIWERLNSYTVEDGFGGNNSMNSFNHYSFGAVGSWMYNYSLGIRRGEPGFKRFELRPEPDPTGQMVWAKGYYDSMYGRISSEWQVDGDQLIYRTTVPPNTSAILYLPASDPKKVEESERKARKADGVEFLRYENGLAVYELVSGTYEFQTTYSPGL